MTFSKDFFEWVREHIADNPSTLRLKYSRSADGFDYDAAITQIECRRKFGKKLAGTLAMFPDFYFPSVMSGEQATADIVATFHATLAERDMPMADLTAGLGIDVLHVADKVSSIVAVERDTSRAEALEYNSAGMGASNVKVVCNDCNAFIDSVVKNNSGSDSAVPFATAFIDPARRAADGGRVFALSDCEPDVVKMLPRMSAFCRRLIIKASPMLDISHTIAEISPRPVAIMAVGTPTECKELLIVVNFKVGNASADAQETPTLIEAVTLYPDGTKSIFSFTQQQERDSEAPPVMPELVEGTYICEPNPMLMKTGAFRILAASYGLSMFHANTRIFVTDKIPDNFPGTVWRVVKVLPYASRIIKRFSSEYPVINVAVRNFGMSADALRTKLGVRDGGPLRLYGFTDANQRKILAVTAPI
ncbi:MAG: hypothetical protein OSJ37_06840 [Muribaculaceae bacterium]|jgi:hypothetical protein|nr:hypothetical protein [Muribaculaceae bacterium]